MAIRGDTWDPIDVPLTLFLTDIRTTPLDTLKHRARQYGKTPIDRPVIRWATESCALQDVGWAQLHTGLTMTAVADLYSLAMGETRPFEIPEEGSKLQRMHRC